MVIHKRRALGENSVVVGVLDLVGDLAVVINGGPVIYRICIGVNEADFLNPVPSLFSPV